MCLDVFEGEASYKEEKPLFYEPKNLEVLANLVEDYTLLSKDNIIFTPHIAFYSKEVLERILETTVENIASFVSGNHRMLFNPKRILLQLLDLPKNP